MVEHAEEATDASTAAPEQDLLNTPQAGTAVIRGGTLRIAGYAVGVLVSVGSSAVLFRHLHTVAAGHYITILSLVTLTAGITDAGLSGIGVRELSTLAPEKARAMFRNLFGIRMVLSLIGVLVALCFSLLSYPSTLVAGTLLAGVGVLFQTSQDTFAIPLQARLRLGWVTGVDAIRQLVTAVAIIALVVAGASLLPFWGAAALGGLAGTIAAASLVRGTFPLLPAFDLGVSMPLLRETAPFALAAAVGAVYYRIAILVMSLVASAVQTGYFGASFRVMEVLIVVPQLLVGASFPVFARAARDDMVRFNYAVGRMVDVTLLVGLAAGLGVVTGAPFIIKVIAGAEFAPAAAVLRIQGLALIASFIAASTAYGLLALRRYRAILLVNLAVLALSAVLTGVLASSDGATGAATGVVIVEALYAVMLAVALHRAGARPHVSRGSIPRALAAAGLGALLLIPPGLPDIARPILALLVYAAAALLLGAVPEEILEQLRAIRGRAAR